MIPRQVFTVWYQGEEAAPPLVKQCLRSWRTLNPGWEMRVLSERDIPPELATGRLAALPPAQRSDLLRLHLLAEHGGVWVDATVFAAEALDGWLPDLLPSGYFAFARPGRDRVMATWFLAADAGSYLPSSLYERLASYWSSRAWRNDRRRVLRAATERLLGTSERTARLWFAPPFEALAQIYPYYAHHYLFAERVRSDPRFAEIWGATPKVSADGPHSVQVHGMLAPPTEALRLQIEQRRVPVYKLNRRVDLPAVLDDSTAVGLLVRTTLGPT